MAEVVVFNVNWKPEISSDLISMPSLQMKLVYDDVPAGRLRNLAQPWALFQKHFDARFKPRLKFRHDALQKQMVNDVRDWEVAAEDMPDAGRAAFAAAKTQELDEWLQRWLRLVEKDCALSCDEAYKQTQTELKSEVTNARFTAVAKAATVGVVKVAAGAVAVATGHGAVAIGIGLASRAKSLKTTADKFQVDWAALDAITEQVLKDIPDVQSALNRHKANTAGGSGAKNKIKAFWTAVEAPAKKLEADINKMDQAIAIARETLQLQSEQITPMIEQVKKAGNDPNFAKIIAELAKEKADRARLAQQLVNASQAKANAQKGLKEMKEAKFPDFALLTKSVGEVKKGAAAKADVGKDITDLIGEIVSHFKK